MKQINYVDYKHSYAHAIAPKMKQLNMIVNVSKKPVNYVKAVIKNTLNQSKDKVVWTEKEDYFFNTVMEKSTSQEIYYYCRNAVNKAKETFVYVDNDGELIK